MVFDIDNKGNIAKVRLREKVRSETLTVRMPVSSVIQYYRNNCSTGLISISRNQVKQQEGKSTMKA